MDFEESFIFKLSGFYRNFIKQIDRDLDKLTLSQCLCLYLLKKYKKLNMIQFANVYKADRTTVSRNLQTLADMKLLIVDRQKGRKDVFYTITPMGESLLDRMLPKMIRWEKHFTSQDKTHLDALSSKFPTHS